MGCFLEVDEQARYFLVTINREKQLNALNVKLLKELKDWLEKNKHKDKVLILTGKGNKAFVAGADIGEMKDMTPLEAEEFSRLGQEIFAGIYNWSLPTIAAINGFALGGGSELALSCDLRFMKKGAKIGQPEINLGIIPGFGGTYFLKVIVGEAKAKELIFTGGQLEAAEAKDIGLVHKIIDSEDFLNKVVEECHNIIEGPRNALKNAKLSLNSEDILKNLEKERKYFSKLFSSPEQTEGMDAFLNKRRANFEYF